MAEKWTDIPGYVGYYTISNLGRVRSVSRLVSFGKQKRHIPGIIRRPCISGQYKYHAVALSRKGKVTIKYVHRLVWEAFKEMIPNGLEINHKNGNKLDNRLSNLEVMTSAENKRHAIRLGLWNPSFQGMRHPRVKLTDKQVKQIRRWYATRRYTRARMTRMFSVGRTTIDNIVNRETWRHI